MTEPLAQIPPSLILTLEPTLTSTLTLMSPLLTLMSPLTWTLTLAGASAPLSTLLLSTLLLSVTPTAWPTLSLTRTLAAPGLGARWRPHAATKTRRPRIGAQAQRAPR
jgi:hypothetical protein